MYENLSEVITDKKRTFTTINVLENPLKKDLDPDPILGLL